MADRKNMNILRLAVWAVAWTIGSPLAAQDTALSAPTIADEVPADTGPTSQSFTMDRSLRMAVDVRVKDRKSVV